MSRATSDECAINLLTQGALIIAVFFIQSGLCLPPSDQGPAVVPVRAVVRTANALVLGRRDHIRALAARVLKREKTMTPTIMNTLVLHRTRGVAVVSQSM